MASPQVEIVSARNFGCVLRDRNQRHDSVFEKNPKVLVKDQHRHHYNHHPQRSVGLVSSESAVSDENSQNRIDSWIENHQNQKRNNHFRPPKKETEFSDRSKQATRGQRTERAENSTRNENLGGASSLVQIWEARLNRSNGCNPPIQSQSTVSSSRTGSGASIHETLCSGPSIDGEFETADEQDRESKNLDPTVETDSRSDSGESKWSRIADIINRLSKEQKEIAGKNGGCGEVSGLPVIRTHRPCLSSCSSSMVSEKSGIFPVVSFSPRIRGRQAFADLLMQLERDRNRELELLLDRNAVSKFPQRGRLQSMLRLRSLQRCLAIQDRHRFNSKPAGLNRQETGSAILHLKEKFLGNGAKAVTEERNVMSKKDDRREESPKQLEESKKLPEASVTERWKEEAGSGEAERKTCFIEAQERREEGMNEEMKMEVEEEKDVGNEREEEDRYLKRQETSSVNEWEEYEEEESYYSDMKYDWVSDISRPRSYWEDLRKNRYMEVMTNTLSQKEDLPRLLERRTVSSFLESDMRENIDKVIMSRVQQDHPFLHNEEQSENYEDDEEEEEEEEDRVSSRSSSQMFTSSPRRSWSSRDTGTASTPLLPIQNHPSSEIEMVNDLRAQIQRLQQEMSELREAVRICQDSNMFVQNSAHRENPLTRKCRVCNETLVETLLYRCGHMCACLKCAKELHWKGGKCPICRAHILDVILIHS